jgi:hypothetical protein
MGRINRHDAFGCRSHVLHPIPGCIVERLRFSADQITRSAPGLDKENATVVLENRRVVRGAADSRIQIKDNPEPCRKESDLMSLQEVLPEQLAELFHHYHQALAPDLAVDRKACFDSWEQVPSPEKKRMITAARLALLELLANGQQREGSRKYFAQPGEAEWGC